MIAGLVSEMTSRTVVAASTLTGRQARTARATVAHQSAVATAGCAPSGQGEKAVSGLSAPMPTWATKRMPVPMAAAPRPGTWWRRRQAPATPTATRIPTAAAT